MYVTIRNSLRSVLMNTEFEALKYLPDRTVVALGKKVKPTDITIDSVKKNFTYSKHLNTGGILLEEKNSVWAARLSFPCDVDFGAIDNQVITLQLGTGEKIRLAMVSINENHPPENGSGGADCYIVYKVTKTNNGG